MNIVVTKADIRKGQRHVCDKCPIALAVARRIGRTVDVYDGEVKIKGRATQLPFEARVFVRYFDWIGVLAVEPFMFKLPPLSQWESR